jgi:hypothetical protein
MKPSRRAGNIGVPLASYAPLQVLLPGRPRRVGLINMAYNLPLVVAPPATGVVQDLMNSYPALFALVGVVSVMAAVTVRHVRSVT